MLRQPEEDLEDLRKKFNLLEGDRKLFYHSSSLAKQKNREQIQQLQKENKELRESLKSRVGLFFLTELTIHVFFNVIRAICSQFNLKIFKNNYS